MWGAKRKINKIIGILDGMQKLKHRNEIEF